VAYFLLTGQPPFSDRTQVQVLAAHLYEAPKPLAEVRTDVPLDLAGIVHRCLAKSSAARFPDAVSLDDELSHTVAARQWIDADAAQWWCSHLRSRKNGPNA
jgi:serine/threonine-protein kinase